jgi:ribonuclease HII
LKKEEEKTLKKMGARDSKVLLHSDRVRISKEIKKNVLAFEVVMATPGEIDRAIHDKINLNTLEAMKCGEIINELNSGNEKILVVVDCPSVNTEAWKKKLIEFIDNVKNLDIRCEHKADANYSSVSAASILAKVAREEEVAKIKKEFGNIGSGYPSDPKTKEFLRKEGKRLEGSGIFRKSWATWKKLYSSSGKEQKSLGDY